jgi:hypothetical protein
VLLVAVHITKCVDESSIWVEFTPSITAVSVVGSFMGMAWGRLIPIRAPAILREKVDDVGTAFDILNRSRLEGEWSKEKRNQEKSADTHDPTTDF